MSLLTLPTEMMLEVAAYLDWTKEDVCPTKPDLVSLATTCSQLREAIIPLLFKDVTLRLRWAGPFLIMPSLYKLRLHCPHLAEHIRTVCIRRSPDDDAMSADESKDSSFFRAPRQRPNWLDLASVSSPGDESMYDEFRKRATRAAWKLAHPESTKQQDFGSSAEEIISQAISCNSLDRAGLDALTIAMLCVPKRAKNIICVSLRQHSKIPGNKYKASSKSVFTKANTNVYSSDSFAARVATAAFELLKGNVEDITWVSNVPLSDQRSIARAGSALPPVEGRVLDSELIGTLAPRRLVLAMSEGASKLYGAPLLSTLRLDVWHTVASTLRVLELKHIHANTTELLQLIAGFDSLESLSLSNVTLRSTRVAYRGDAVDEMAWLLLCLDVRHVMQHPKVELECLAGPNANQDKLSACVVAWIRDMAIPSGAIIGFERRERLVEDFRSFLPLWAAEQDEDRGIKALEEWNTSLGRSLCDAAMSRRWR